MQTGVSMKVLRLHSTGEFLLHDEPIPEFSVNESLIRVTAVGVCGSDLHWFSEGGIGDAGLTRPLVLGHEFAGVIQDGEMKGDRVAVDPLIPCDVCEYCLEGNPNLCVKHHFAGHAEDDGALCEYISWPRSFLHRLPETLSDVDGAMLEPLGVAIHTVDLGKIKPGMTVGVYGCGPIGLLILQVARIAGAVKIIATDHLPHRIDAAREFGATEVVQAASGKENPEVLALTNNRGVDVAFEAAGENGAVETAVETCKPGGRVILCGIPGEDWTGFRASAARRKGLTIKLVRRMKLTYPRAIRLVDHGLVDVRSLVTHRFSMEEYKEAFSIAQKREGLKVIIVP
jgi:L-iditol 2-dehydrogenase